MENVSMQKKRSAFYRNRFVWIAGLCAAVAMR